MTHIGQKPAAQPDIGFRLVTRRLGRRRQFSLRGQKGSAHLEPLGEVGLERLVITDVTKDSGQAPAPDPMLHCERTNLEPSVRTVCPAHPHFQLAHPVIARAPRFEQGL